MSPVPLLDRPVTLARAVGAEQLRWRRSAAARLPLLGLAAAVLQGLLYLAGSTRHGWAALTAWQILWVSFLGPVATGLLAGLLGRRELVARGGGAWWRPITGRRAHLAAFAILAGYALVMHAAVLLAAVPFGWIDGLGMPGPIPHLVLVAAVQWAASLALLAVAHQVAVRRGVFAAAGTGLVWALAGTFTAESSSWWWQPWAWSVRAMLPLTGTHANGIPLQPDEPLATAAVWPPLLATMVLAAAVAAAGSRPWLQRPLLRLSHRLPPRVPRRGAAGRLPDRWRSSGPTGALLDSLRRTSIAPLLLTSAATLPLGLTLWADPGYTQQLVALALLPLGTTLLPVLAWQATLPAWRALSVRTFAPATLVGRLALVLVTASTAFAGYAAVALVVAGVPPASAGWFAVAAATTAATLTCWHLWLAIRAGTGAALAAGAVGTLLALVVGGTGLAGPLWPVTPWAWAVTAADPTRLVWCLPATLVLTGALLAACRRAGTRAAAQNPET